MPPETVTAGASRGNDDAPRDHAVMVDHEGHLLVSCYRELRRLTATELFSVVVVWTEGNAEPCVCWLTTQRRWSVAFSVADVEHSCLMRWLAELPGWDPIEWSRARETPGLYLVWRCPADAGPDPHRAAGAAEDPHSACYVVDDVAGDDERLPRLTLG